MNENSKLLGSETPLSERYTKYHGKSNGSFSFITATSFAINTIIGCGVLGVPWSFIQGGIIMSSLLLLFLTILCVFAADCLMDVMARAEAIERFHLLKNTDLEDPPTRTPRGRHILHSPPKFRLVDRTFEIAELVNIFLSKKWSIIYTICFFMNALGALWAYVTIFANAFDELLSPSYEVFWAIFGISAIILTCMELKEQVILQIIMSILRFVVIFLLVGSVALPYFQNKKIFDDIEHDHVDEMEFVRWGGIAKVLPIVGLAQVLHHMIPSITRDVKRKEKAARVFTTALSLSCLLYFISAATLAAYFGGQIKSSVNLNWDKYLGPKAVKYFILAFPGLDVLSAFPLMGTAIANNVMSVFEKRMDKAQKNRFKMIKYRLLVAIPPIIGAYFVRDLGVILDFSGLFAFASFIFPFFLISSAYKKCVRIWGARGRVTPFSTWVCKPTFGIVLGLFTSIIAIACFIILCADTIF
eukprot:TRINITY_DN6004_c0_g1_i1.p1 TRINITY_DN6004_c0_g1~~TRINITY_DN6004_c0_g1_i1.p1  ORF type:complete len:486 (+),score=113.55 TRINITY_DN6004_c0_g1_i1:47-1459(+)